MLVAGNCGCRCGSFNVSFPGPVPVVVADDVPALLSDELPVEVLPVFDRTGVLVSIEVTWFGDDGKGVPEPHMVAPRPSRGNEA